MKRLKVFIDTAFDKLTIDDWDNVLIIAGDEGISKSTLGQWILDYWLMKLYGKVTPTDIKFIGLDMKQFVFALKNLKKYELVIYDEAGELSSLRMMDKFNFAITQAYQVIRGENLFTILILPDIFYINPFFSSRRARGFIQVYKRGRFAYWNKTRLRKMIEVNKKHKRKSVWRVKPLFHDTFPIYNGILKQAYAEKKKAKTSQIREKLYDKMFVNQDNEDQILKWFYNAKEIVGVSKASKIFEVTPKTVYNKYNEYMKNSRQNMYFETM